MTAASTPISYSTGVTWSSDVPWSGAEGGGNIRLGACTISWHELGGGSIPSRSHNLPEWLGALGSNDLEDEVTLRKGRTVRDG